MLEKSAMEIPCVPLCSSCLILLSTNVDEHQEREKLPWQQGLIALSLFLHPYADEHADVKTHDA